MKLGPVPDHHVIISRRWEESRSKVSSSSIRLHHFVHIIVQASIDEAHERAFFKNCCIAQRTPHSTCSRHFRLHNLHGYVLKPSLLYGVIRWRKLYANLIRIVPLHWLCSLSSANCTPPTVHIMTSSAPMNNNCTISIFLKYPSIDVMNSLGVRFIIRFNRTGKDTFHYDALIFETIVWELDNLPMAGCYTEIAQTVSGRKSWIHPRLNFFITIGLMIRLMHRNGFFNDVWQRDLPVKRFTGSGIYLSKSGLGRENRPN